MGACTLNGGGNPLQKKETGVLPRQAEEAGIRPQGGSPARRVLRMVEIPAPPGRARGVSPEALDREGRHEKNYVRMKDQWSFSPVQSS